MDAADGAEKDGTPVEQGTGPNSASYFVCTELASGPFNRLPDVRPGQIKVARRLKRFLTGHLDSEVRPDSQLRRHGMQATASWPGPMAIEAAESAADICLSVFSSMATSPSSVMTNQPPCALGRIC